MAKVYGKNLQVGDIIQWVDSDTRTVSKIEKWKTPLACFPHGALFVYFDDRPFLGMTVDNEDIFEVLNRTPIKSSTHDNSKALQNTKTTGQKNQSGRHAPNQKRSRKP